MPLGTAHLTRAQTNEIAATILYTLVFLSQVVMGNLETSRTIVHLICVLLTKRTFQTNSELPTEIIGKQSTGQIKSK